MTTLFVLSSDFMFVTLGINVVRWLCWDIEGNLAYPAAYATSLSCHVYVIEVASCVFSSAWW